MSAQCPVDTEIGLHSLLRFYKSNTFNRSVRSSHTTNREVVAVCGVLGTSVPTCKCCVDSVLGAPARLRIGFSWVIYAHSTKLKRAPAERKPPSHPVPQSPSAILRRNLWYLFVINLPESFCAYVNLKNQQVGWVQ